MNLPLFLTSFRFLLAPLLAVLVLAERPGTDLWALAVLWVAAGTDLLDGFLARRQGQTSVLGTLLDPIADKLLTSAAFVALMTLEWVPVWMVAIILGREYAVSGLRSLAATEGYTVGASDLGKAKMASQVACISFLILGARLPVFRPLGQVLLWLVVILALISALQYFQGLNSGMVLRILPRRLRWPLFLRRGRKEDVSTR